LENVAFDVGGPHAVSKISTSSYCRHAGWSCRPNGSGKTTLLRLLFVRTNPDCRRNPHCRLSGRSSTSIRNRVLDPEGDAAAAGWRRTVTPVIYQDRVIHGCLLAARFPCLAGEQLNQPVGRLSRCERARVADRRGFHCCSQRTWLLLDEAHQRTSTFPTLEVLEEKLARISRRASCSFTHDRYLLDRVSNYGCRT